MTIPARPRHEWSESHDPAVMRMVLGLHRVRELAFSWAHETWTRHGLTASEFDVLATLRNAPPPHELTPSQLGVSVLITSGGLTKIMRQLETKRLITRPRQQADMRVKPLKLTPTGRRLVETAMAELAATSGARVRELLTADEIAALTALLRKMAPDLRVP